MLQVQKKHVILATSGSSDDPNLRLDLHLGKIFTIGKLNKIFRRDLLHKNLSEMDKKLLSGFYCTEKVSKEVDLATEE